MSACSSSGSGSGEAQGTSAGTTGGDASGGQEASDVDAVVVHSFGAYELGPLEEVEPCLQWSLDNEQAIYVNEVTFTNNGGFHHSNWYFVPEDVYEGPDGFFDCRDRGFDELAAAVSGGVLWAQSTQSRLDGMQLPEGVVVKIPPRHKIIAGGHLLNMANAPYTTEARMSLGFIHPSEVSVVAAPFRLTYRDLHIPAGKTSHFTGTCDLRSTYESAAGKPFDLQLYYVMPHYHYLGTYFDLSIAGGARDGESVFRLEQFNADNNGRVYDPPIDLGDATGLTFTCGYDNWRDVDIGWGIGDQEMCVMLGLADSAVLMDAAVQSGSTIVDVVDGVQKNEGPCTVIGLPKNQSQSLPSEDERAGEIYVPPSDPEDAELPSVPACEDTPTDAFPILAPTLSNIRDTLFASSCQFSACHDRDAPVAGLDLQSDALHAELLGHDVQGDPAASLVVPGEPESSYLYRLISRCDPTTSAGTSVRHMPLNAPFLADPGYVAMVREWIAAGAKND